MKDTDAVAAINIIYWPVIIALTFAMMIEFRWLIAAAWDLLVEAWKDAGRNVRNRSPDRWD